MLLCSACSSFAVFASHSLSLCVSADVAVHWISLATIVQHAREQGCWEGEASPLRVPLLECVERQEGVAMNFLVRDMDLALPNAHDARRLEILADALPLFGGAQLAVDTTGVMGLPDLVPQTQTGLPWLRLDASRNAPVRSWSQISCTPCGSCWGSRRPMVRGNSGVPSPAGTGQSSFGTAHPPEKS